jgi:hypothetical protein
MAGIRSIHRGPTVKGYASAASVPLRVDSATNTLKFIPGGSGTTEIQIPSASDAPVQVTATGALTVATHAGVPVVFNNAAGGTLTLPNATGSGAKFLIFIGTTLTSGPGFVLQVSRSADYFRGQASTIGSSGITIAVTANTGTLASESDTMTWNRGTTGLATQGDYVELLDFAPNVWSIDAIYQSSGVAATPFSAAV